MNKPAAGNGRESAVSEQFRALRESGRRGLIPFITAGYPEPELTVSLMQGLVEAGADLIELGIPFSDPMADGPVIQKASDVALRHGVSLDAVLRMVGEFRLGNRHTPVLLMGYLNPIEKMGYSRFAERAASAGVNGILVVDLPPEDADPLLEEFRRFGLECIFLVAPNTEAPRLGEIAARARGFIYYVALKGVTGASHLDPARLSEGVRACREKTGLPVAVGFGITDAASARAVAEFSDAVVVGSALIRQMEALWEAGRRKEEFVQRVSAFVAELRQALDTPAQGEA